MYRIARKILPPLRKKPELTFSSTGTVKPASDAPMGIILTRPPIAAVFVVCAPPGLGQNRF